MSNDEVHWDEAKYALFFDNNHFTYSSQGNLIKWQHIKPYEEEIKVGDWVFLNDEKGVCKITEKHDLKEVNNSFTLVKNPQLIELLNKEL